MSPGRRVFPFYPNLLNGVTAIRRAENNIIKTLTEANVHATGVRTWRDDVEEIFEVVHPHLCQAPVVLVNDLARSSGEAVRGGLPEHVAHV